MYIGHVGDSGIILGYQEEGDPSWKAKPLTRDHKPESIPERTRIHESGGKVVSKSGVPRVVWNRPRIGHKGPVRRSTHIDEIPFLAVARSLGDLWSYNSELDTFVVSPEPDVRVVTVDVKSHRCLIFGTDGLWNMLSPQKAVSIVQEAENHNEMHFVASQQTGNGNDAQMWMNPSKSLVDHALNCWSSTRLRADNTSVVTLMLDPPGPSRGEVLLSRKKERMADAKPVVSSASQSSPSEEYSKSGGPGTLPTTPEAINPPEASDEISSDSNPPAASPLANNSENSGDPEDSNAEDSSDAVDPEVKTTEKNSEPVVQSSKPVVMAGDETPEVHERASESSESIQVAEVSSSDATFNNDEASKSSEESSEDSGDGKPDSPSKDFGICENVKPLNPSNNLQKLLLSSKAESFKIARQNAFSGSCEELKNGPRLRRSAQFGIQSIKDVSGGCQTRRRPHSTISDKRGNMMIARSELRSAKRRQTVNHLQMMPATSSGLGGDCLRESGDGDADREGTSKRRRSSAFDNGEDQGCSLQEPCSKRRTRSEDRSPRDENEPDNQGKLVSKQQGRVRCV